MCIPVLHSVRELDEEVLCKGNPQIINEITRSFSI